MSLTRDETRALDIARRLLEARADRLMEQCDNADPAADISRLLEEADEYQAAADTITDLRLLNKRH